MEKENKMEIKIGPFSEDGDNFFKSNRTLENGHLINIDMMKSKRVYVKASKGRKAYTRTDPRTKHGGGVATASDGGEEKKEDMGKKINAMSSEEFKKFYQAGGANQLHDWGMNAESANMFYTNKVIQEEQASKKEPATKKLSDGKKEEEDHDLYATDIKKVKDILTNILGNMTAKELDSFVIGEPIKIQNEIITQKKLISKIASHVGVSKEDVKLELKNKLKGRQWGKDIEGQNGEESGDKKETPKKEEEKAAKVPTLEDIEAFDANLWKKLEVKSGGQLENNSEKLAQYKAAVKEHWEKNLGGQKLSQKLGDDLEDENRHSVYAALREAGAFRQKGKESMKKEPSWKEQVESWNPENK